MLLGTSDGRSITVGNEEAIGAFSAAFRAMQVHAGSIGSLPLKAYRDTAKGRVEASSSFLSAPHRDLTPFEWRELIGLHVASWGNAYLAVETNGAGAAVFADPLPPSRVVPKKVSPTEGNPAGKVYEVSYDDGTKATLLPWPAGPILHIPGMGYDGIVGLSRIGAARKGISSGLAGEDAASKLWSNGMLADGIIRFPGDLTPEQAKEASLTFRDRLTGLARAGEVPVLGSDATFERLTINPRDAQFLESREFDSTMVARLFGLGDDLRPGNADDYLKWTLLPDLRRIEQRISRLLPRGQFAEFVTAGLLRADTAQRYAAHAVAIQNGFETPEEARVFENWPVVPTVGALARLGPNTGTPNAHLEAGPRD